MKCFMAITWLARFIYKECGSLPPPHYRTFYRVILRWIFWQIRRLQYFFLHSTAYCVVTGTGTITNKSPDDSAVTYYYQKATHGQACREEGSKCGAQRHRQWFAYGKQTTRRWMKWRRNDFIKLLILFYLVKAHATIKFWLQSVWRSSVLRIEGKDLNINIFESLPDEMRLSMVKSYQQERALKICLLIWFHILFSIFKSPKMLQPPPTI